jgi:hypothetical protein
MPSASFPSDHYREPNCGEEEDIPVANVTHTGTTYGAGHYAALANRPALQAQVILYVGFIVLPILAGLDKFVGVLVNWDIYLAPVVTDVLRLQPHTFMMSVGVIEVAAGLIVLVRPQIGAYVVALWLLGIIVNLLVLSGQTSSKYYDIALRDLGLLLGALALARLSREFGGIFERRTA